MKKAIEQALSEAQKKWEQENGNEAWEKWTLEKENEFEMRLKRTMKEAKTVWEMEHQTGVVTCLRIPNLS